MGTILIINALPIFRAGLRHVLKDAGFLSTVHEAQSTNEAQEFIVPDLKLVIMDPAGPGAHPAVFVQQLRKDVGHVPILFFGGRDAPLFASLAAKLGVNGYLGKLSDEKTIAATIQMVLGGMQCFPPQSDSGALTGKMHLLTQKELMVLMLLRQGLRNIDIAHKLYLSEKTISAHKRNILLKLGVNAITQIGESEAFLERFPEVPIPMSGCGLNLNLDLPAAVN
ncbi:MAG TPA: response regulator transcription factor [Eoetvoesiella sp.]